MRAFRKISLFIAFLGFSAFLSLSVAENFHHHGDLESHDDCSLCSWQQSDSKAVTTALPVLLFAVFVFSLTPRPVLEAKSFRVISLPGRSPPVLL